MENIARCLQVHIYEFITIFRPHFLTKHMRFNNFELFSKKKIIILKNYKKSICTKKIFLFHDNLHVIRLLTFM